MRITSKGLRDLFFLMAGTAIAYQQFFVREEPSPLGVFMVLFLWGLVPAFRADSQGVGLSVLQALLGAKGSQTVELEGREDREERVAQAERAARAARVRAEVRAAEEAQAERERRDSRSSHPPSSGPDSP